MMNKSMLVDEVANELAINKSEAARVVEAVFACLARGVAEHKKVTIAGFGAFMCKVRPARVGVHPITRAPMQIAEIKTCAFRAAPALRALCEGAPTP